MLDRDDALSVSIILGLALGLAIVVNAGVIAWRSVGLF